MATNPMQKKARIAFISGVLVTLLVAAIAIALLYMKIRNQQEQLNEYGKSTQSIYVLSQDVKSGQILDSSMFIMKKAMKETIPSDATTDVMTMLQNATLVDTAGRTINSPTAEKNYYYYRFSGRETDYIIYKENDVEADMLQPGDRGYFYAGDNKTQRTDIEVAKTGAVIAKIAMKANTIITRNSIAVSDEITTDDLRKEEYNVIQLPVDLNPDEYVDVRLMLPNGQNYIVVSKKKVTIPSVNGEYLADTIQMNLTEEEILTLSCAIYENYKIQGSKLYATRYTEAGIQNAATKTYKPNNYVINLIKNNQNIVSDAKNALSERNNSDIDRALNQYGDEENLPEKVLEGTTNSKEARKNYLQTLPAVQ